MKPKFIVQLRSGLAYLGPYHHWTADLERALKFDTLEQAMAASGAYDVIYRTVDQ